MSTVLKNSYTNSFSCLGADCEDTCCKGWGMQLDLATKEKYDQVDELKDAVSTGEAEWIMKRDPKTDYCVKFSDGLCSIHRDYGSDYLGDACNFFPRSTRKTGDVFVMTSTLSCPEVTRLALFGEYENKWIEVEESRLPESLKDYSMEDISGDDMLVIHQAFLDACYADSHVSVERLIARFMSVVNSMQMLEKSSWAGAVSFYLKNADMRLPAPEVDINDQFNLIYALVGLISASKPTARPRLDETISDIEKAIKISFSYDPLAIHADNESYIALQNIKNLWHEKYKNNFEIMLKKWLAAELSIGFFPFAGLGRNAIERMVIIAVRFATVKLALQSFCALHDRAPKEQESIRIVQSIARFMDHLADPEFSLNIYNETGWVKESRLRSLIGDE